LLEANNLIIIADLDGFGKATCWLPWQQAAPCPATTRPYLGVILNQLVSSILIGPT
jgi:hypothetical protein